MNSNNKYYFSKEDKKIVINVLDNRKYEISELEEHPYGKLYTEAFSVNDLTEFSAYMNAIFIYRDIILENEPKTFCFLSLDTFENISKDLHFLDDVEQIENDVKMLYQDKDMQLKWNFQLLHPICFEIYNYKIIYRPIKDLSEDIRNVLFNRPLEVDFDNTFNNYVKYINNTQKYVDAQKINYSKALSEIKNGKKISHWMWYIFPQVVGLGKSDMSNYYSFKNKEEVEFFLANEYLHNNLLKISNELYNLEGTDINNVMSEVDSLKLKSSMTLFAIVDKKNNIYEKILKKYYNNEKDEFTIRFLRNN